MEEYGYEIWFDGCCIHAEDGFESEEDARDDAESEIALMLESDEYVDNTESDFEIITK